MRLSLLRSPQWPDPTADRGFHFIEYALFPHKGRIDKSEVTRAGYEFNYPVIAAKIDKQKGSLPVEYSFVKLTPANLILTAVKMSEDGPDTYIYQFYETKGEDTLAKLELPGKPNKVELTNFLEEGGQPVTLRGNSVEIKIKSYSVMTLKVSY